MSKYTLKTYSGSKQLERFEHRSPYKLHSILSHSRYDRAGECDAWGVPLDQPDKFEIYDSHMVKLFSGNITDALKAAGNL